MAPSLTSPDTLATAALALCVAAGKAHLKTRVTITRHDCGRHEYFVVVQEEGDFGRATVGAGHSWTSEGALTALAKSLNCEWPLAAAPTYVVLGSAEVITPTQANLIYATASQKEEIIRLLNHPLITRQEKTKMLLNINRLDDERATQAIAKLRKAIEDREGTTAVAA